MAVAMVGSLGHPEQLGARIHKKGNLGLGHNWTAWLGATLFCGYSPVISCTSNAYAVPSPFKSFQTKMPL